MISIRPILSVKDGINIEAKDSGIVESIINGIKKHASEEDFAIDVFRAFAHSTIEIAVDRLIKEKQND